jgi:glucose 1-dehydrogenase
VAPVTRVASISPSARLVKAHARGDNAISQTLATSDYVTGTTIFVDGGMTLYPGFIWNG